MDFMRRIALAALGLVMCAAMIGFVGPASAAETEPEMTQQQAAEEYLDVVCASIAATKLYNRRVYQGDPVIVWDWLRDRFPQVRRATAALSRARAHAARNLLNPPAPWPVLVEDKVRIMVNSFLRESNLYARAAWAQRVSEWDRLDVLAGRLARKSSRVSGDIRADLGLPPPGLGC